MKKTATALFCFCVILFARDTFNTDFRYEFSPIKVFN